MEKLDAPQFGDFNDADDLNQSSNQDGYFGERQSFIIPHSKKMHNQGAVDKQQLSTMEEDIIEHHDQQDIVAGMEDMDLHDPEGSTSPAGESTEANFDFTVVGNSINVGRHSLLLNALIESGAVQDVSHALENNTSSNIMETENANVKKVPRVVPSTVTLKKNQQNENIAPASSAVSSKGLTLTKPVPFKFHQSREKVAALSNGESKELKDIQKRVEGNKQLLQKNRQAYIKALNAAPFKVVLSDKKPTVPQPFQFQNKVVRERGGQTTQDAAPSVKPAKAISISQATGPVKLTQPVEFKFRTDKRIAQKGVSSSNPPVLAATNRPKSAPPATTIAKPAQPKLTKPVEFKFQSDRRAKDRNSIVVAPTSASFKSTAECIKDFLSKTPARFRTKSKLNKSDTHLPVAKLQLTEPVNVVFATSGRRRPTAELSSEDKELEYIRNHEPFKAKPVNEKILHSAGDLGVPRIRKRPLTEAVGPKFLTDDRLGPKAVEVPAIKVPTDPVKLASEPLTVTKPHSPKLMTKERAKMKPEPLPEPEEPLPPPFVALPLPDFSIVQKKEMALPKPALTSPKPFNLATESRGAVAKEKFMHQVEEQMKNEQEAREFKAQPILLASDLPAVGNVTHKKLCSPAPFHLASVERSMIARHLFQEKLSKELEMAAEARQFKARQLPVTTMKPQVMNLHPAPVTSPEPVVLNSDMRALRRQEYEEEQQRKEDQARELREAAEKEQAERDRIELKHYRRSLDFKAIPIMKANPVTVQRSEKALTSPHTPFLRTKTRALEAEIREESEQQ